VKANSEVTIAGEKAWKIFTCGISGEAVLQCAAIQGDYKLGSKVLGMVAVIA
jgi:hypothetical protein